MARRTGEGRIGEGRTGADRAAAAAVENDLSLLKMEAELAALRWSVEAQAGLPEGWGQVAAEHPTQPRKRKVTLLLDEDVAAFWRRQGAGYQARINAVLRLYMAAKVSGKV
jgi:uncharacterized protein (DUF4415 family)